MLTRASVSDVPAVLCMCTMEIMILPFNSIPVRAGLVCGVQSSIQSSFETVSFLAGIFLRNPGEFWAMCLASLCTVGFALFLYALYLIRHRRQSSRQLLEEDVEGRDEEQRGLLAQENSSEISLSPRAEILTVQCKEHD